jgi:phosphoribosylanthranilate isomerase
MIVKICGITTLEDALLAVDNGADMLGFNFYPLSPRYISPKAAAQIHRVIQNRGLQVSTVGVFVNTPPSEVKDILDTCGLETAQLAGDESPHDLASLERRAFKSIRPANLDEAQRMAADFAQLQNAPAFLLDARVAGQYGGTGQTVDWEMARALAGQYPLLLAGGLTPDNLVFALERANPWGVDVASGVESTPGRKDSTKLVEFLRIAHRYTEGAGI